MKLKEFLESVVTLLDNGVYYCDKPGTGSIFETPVQVKKLTDKVITAEFFNPQDTFTLTIQRNDYDGPKVGSSNKDKS